MGSVLGFVNWGSTLEYGEDTVLRISLVLANIAISDLTQFELDKQKFIMERLVKSLDKEIQNFESWLGNHLKFVALPFVSPQTAFTWEMEHMLREAELRQFSLQMHILIDQELLTQEDLTVAMELLNVLIPGVEAEFLANQIIEHTMESISILQTLLDGQAEAASKMVLGMKNECRLPGDFAIRAQRMLKTLKPE